MKKLMMLFLGLLVLKSLSAQWFDEGSEYYYDYHGLSSKGVVTLTYEKDTMINNNILLLLNYQYEGRNHATGKEITYERRNYEMVSIKDSIVICYLMYREEPDTLYNFYLHPGQVWKISESYQEDSIIGKVLDKGIADQRPWMKVEYSYGKSNEKKVYYDSIVWGIGNTEEYFFFRDVYEGEVDGHSGGPFRCFVSEEYTYSVVDGECNYDFTINTKEHPHEQIHLYPNPATTSIYINGFEKLKDKTYSVMNLSGQVIFQGSVTSEKIDVTSCPTGVYFLRIGSAIEKFIML